MIIGNGTEIQSVFYNGVDLDRVIYNGVVVFEKGPKDPLIDFTYFQSNDYYILTGWKGTYGGTPSTKCIIPNLENIKLGINENDMGIAEDPCNRNIYLSLPNRNITVNFLLYNFSNYDDIDNLLEVTISNPKLLKYNTYTLESFEDGVDRLSLLLDTLALGEDKITIEIKIGEMKCSINCKVSIAETVPFEWTIEKVPDINDESSYYPSFILNENGYYENENKGMEYSMSFCKVHIYNPGNLNVYIDCIQNSEHNSDYAILSKVNKFPLDEWGYPMSDALEYDFYYENTALTSVNYGPIEGDIYICYQKGYDDGYNDTEDSFQFKVRAE